MSAASLKEEILYSLFYNSNYYGDFFEILSEFGDMDITSLIDRDTIADSIQDYYQDASDYDNEVIRKMFDAANDSDLVEKCLEKSLGKHDLFKFILSYQGCTIEALHPPYVAFYYGISTYMDGPPELEKAFFALPVTEKLFDYYLEGVETANDWDRGMEVEDLPGNEIWEKVVKYFWNEIGKDFVLDKLKTYGEPHYRQFAEIEDETVEYLD